MCTRSSKEDCAVIGRPTFFAFMVLGLLFSADPAKAAAMRTLLQPVQTSLQGEPIVARKGPPSLAAMRALVRDWAGEASTIHLRPGSEPPRSLRCSSFQTWQGRRYRPERAFDGDHRTAWVEDAASHGLGEWLSATLVLGATEAPVALVVVPGFAKNAAMFKRNSRPKTLRVDLRCGDAAPASFDLVLQDKRRAQLFVLPGAGASPQGGACTLRIEVLSVYAGTHFPDTSLAEVQLVTVASEAGAWASVAGDNVFELRNVDYARFAEKAACAPVPPSATQIYVSSVRVIDGHAEFVRFVADEKEALAACGTLCEDANKVSTLPPLWPTKSEVDAPGWFVMQASSDDVDTWLRIDAKPHTSTDSLGNEISCGYQRASGAMFSRHRASRTHYGVDFSIQWYRTGCGG